MKLEKEAEGLFNKLMKLLDIEKGNLTKGEDIEILEKFEKGLHADKACVTDRRKGPDALKLVEVWRDVLFYEIETINVKNRNSKPQSQGIMK